SPKDLKACITALNALCVDPEFASAMARMTEASPAVSSGRTCDECRTFVENTSALELEINELLAQTIDLLSSAQTSFVNADRRLANSMWR
ncbi:MAG: hypothetical protein LBG97_06300, partial [Coriobacteriales bacterium]|nr:hypothetical protein [Coriobacteriales bacterium]